MASAENIESASDFEDTKGAQERIETRQVLSTNFRVVAAIDFGTTHSGVAYSFRDNLADIKTPLPWQDGLHGNQKTATCLLLDEDKSFKAFGFVAQRVYENATEEERRKMFYFHHFKMRLHQERRLSTEMLLEDIHGKKLKALHVFSESIQFLKNKLLETLDERGHILNPLEDIMFVLTVPAIWTDSAKQFMRKAAIKAGIHTQRVTIALEPEAASIYMQYLFAESPDRGQHLSVTRGGTQYIVIDVGGGTADFSVHEKQRDGTLKELHKATGGACGGMCVDRKFLEKMHEIFGKEPLDTFRKDHAFYFNRVMKSFEENKISFDIQVDITSIHNIEKLTRLSIAKFGRTTFWERVARFKDEGITLESDVIRISSVEGSSIMADFFQPTFDLIQHKITNLLKENPGVEMIIMVGGFSGNKYLKSVLKQTFPDKRFVVPDDNTLAVLKGAVIFGFDPLIISSRIVRYTYGFALYKKYDDVNCPDSEKKKRRYKKEGEYVCKGCFEVIIHEGTVVSAPQVISFDGLFPVWHDTEFARIEVYVTSRQGVVFVDEPGVFLIGECRIHNDKDSPVDERKLAVRFRFDGTEINVKVQNDAGAEVNATFDVVE